MMQMKSKLYALSLVTLTMSISSAYAAGFEKTVMWSGKWSGVAGAASGAVQGADSLFYNPAGLVGGSSKEISLNYSPLLTQTSGAQTRDAEKLESDHQIKNVFGVTSKMNLTEDLAAGLGVYVSGGAGSAFKNVDYSAVNSNYRHLKPDVESSVSVLEIGLGSAYRLTKEFSLGVTWRTSVALAKFSSADVAATAAGSALVNTKFNDMKGENYRGLRLGFQYLDENKKWGLGASYRSSIDLGLDGAAEGKAELASNGADLTMTGGKNVNLSTVFPQQLNFGGFYQYSEKGTIFTEYSWTDYSKNKEIKISGDALNLGSTNVLNGKSIVLKWQDAHAIKIGHEYKLGEWDLRAGYALTGRVTSKENVSITFSAPGVGHTFALGTGTHFMNKRLLLDLAGEYSVAKGEGTRGATGISGDYSSEAFGLHSSLRYLF